LAGGRPPKDGIDYAWWDVNIFDNEPKIDKLMDVQGCIGFTIYFYLCQKAYGSTGYYYSWCYADASTTARKVGGGTGAHSVEETVKTCFRVGLLDEKLYEEWKILTSRGIQKRFVRATMNRIRRSVISEYWLLSEEESEGLVKVGVSTLHNSVIGGHNSVIGGHKSVMSHESRVEYKEIGNIYINKKEIDKDNNKEIYTGDNDGQQGSKIRACNLYPCGLNRCSLYEEKKPPVGLSEIREIIEYFNRVTGKKYRVINSYAGYICARYQEGAEMDDFKKVIEIKNEEWRYLQGPGLVDMRRYIRPETLFGDKFWSYLNQESGRRKGSQNDMIGFAIERDRKDE